MYDSICVLDLGNSCHVDTATEREFLLSVPVRTDVLRYLGSEVSMDGLSDLLFLVLSMYGTCKFCQNRESTLCVFQ